MRTLTLYQCDHRATIFLEGEIDLARLTFCDAGGLNVFLTTTRYVDILGGRLRLRHSTPGVRRVFDITDATFLLDPPCGISPSAPRELPTALPRPWRPAASGDQ